MKKFVTLLLTAALAVTAATTAFAAEIKPGENGNPNPANKQIDVTYTVAPSYTVTIPGNVTLSSETKKGEAAVKAENVTVAYGKKVKVALKGNPDFTVKAGKNPDDPTLTYKVWKGTTEVTSVNNTVLEVAPTATDKKGETTLKFEIASGIVYSGTYTGTVTFEVSVG
mgnify:CR=1 FL=1